jgi:soluble lytic murein transglycosylase-like protein
MGLMQLMPATARQYSVTDPYEPAANLEAGIRHLRSLLDRYDIRLALAAYNAGEATVQRHGGLPPYPETRAYVDRVLRRLNHYRGQPAVGRSAVAPGQKVTTVVPTS